MTSMGREAFSPVKACFPSVGECQGADVGEGCWEREHLHGDDGRGMWDGNVAK